MADAKTPIVRQMSVAPTTSAPSQSTGTGNSGPSGSGSDHTKTPQVRTIFSWKPTLENGLHVYAASPAFQWAAKPDPFFGFNPIWDPIQTGRVGPQGPKTGLIGSV